MRNSLSYQQRLDKSKAIVEKLQPFLHGCVALYQSFGSEVMLSELASSCDQYALPRVISSEEMIFYYIDNNTVYKKSNMGIFEPTKGTIALPQDFDVVVVPLLAFDNACYRLGYGNGYYDRYLAKANALRVGVAFECQRCNELNIEPFDQQLDYIITENEIYKAEC